MTRIPTDFPPITQAWFGIWYQSFGAELNPAGLTFVRDRALKPSFVVPLSIHQTPEAVLLEIEAFSPPPDSTYLLIPGTKFDEAGTRHGRGGGWYDRFLATAPAHWLRIGVVADNQWSNTKLIRQEWDQPMDGFLFSDSATVRWSLVPRQSHLGHL